MDFYAAQDHARRQTRRLVLLFGCAVLALIALTNLIIVFGLWSVDEHLFGTWEYVVEAPAMEGAAAPLGPFSYMNWKLFGLVSLIVCAGVGLATLWKSVQLAQGGHRVAEMLGGEVLDPATTHPLQRRLINIVEEMALAASVPVPPVYLLPEAAINAFAAGYTVDDAVIGVTHGALQQLGRDELQGVIGHEFSHILNGDMRLNMRLLAMLNGILFIATAGRVLLRAGSGRPRRGRDSGGSLAMIGFGLLLVGSVGVLFGRMIKAGVSRQREYLADASAVQFTRNPGGLADALKRIGGLEVQGRLHSPRAEEASHLFFADGLKRSLGSLFATHPPLDSRIRRLDPRWSGHFIEARDAAQRVEEEELAISAVAPRAAPPPAQVPIPIAAPGIAQLRIGEELRAACRDPLLACLVVLGCLRNTGSNSALSLGGETATPLPALPADGEQVLQLIDLCMPALKRLGPEELAGFRRDVERVISDDRQLSIGEMMIASLLARHLWRAGAAGRSSAPRYRRPEQVADSLSVLLSALAWACAGEEREARALFDHAQASLGVGGLWLLARDAFDWGALDASLMRLRGLFPLQKPRIVRASRRVLDAASGDGASRAHLLHAIGAAIDCPLPDDAA